MGDNITIVPSGKTIDQNNDDWMDPYINNKNRPWLTGNSWCILVFAIVWVILFIVITYFVTMDGRREQKRRSKNGVIDYSIWFEIIIFILLLFLFFKR